MQFPVLFVLLNTTSSDRDSFIHAVVDECIFDHRVLTSWAKDGPWNKILHGMDNVWEWKRWRKECSFVVVEIQSHILNCTVSVFLNGFGRMLNGGVGWNIIYRFWELIETAAKQELSRPTQNPMPIIFLDFHV